MKNLNPSLFQNIILGILAIFIPFAIVFLTDVLDRTKERNSFEKMVLSIEVLGAKRVFWVSALGIFTLAFFNKESSNFGKLLAIVFTLFLIFTLWQSFRKTLKFSEGHKKEFEIAFLKNLNLSRMFHFGNKRKSERMVSAWNSIWAAESKDDEREFTEAYITHIDLSLATGNYDLAFWLSRAYATNLGKRNVRSTVPDLLPKILEWNEKFRSEEQIRRARRISSREEKQKAAIPKHFPTFRKWASKISKRIRPKYGPFWQWDNFQEQMFLVVAQNLLHDQLGVSHLFSCFKKHIDDSIEKLDELTNPAEKKNQWDYITELLSTFFLMFFENIEKLDGKFAVWKNDFPQDWKITMTNSKKNIPRVILAEFDRWAYQSVLQKDEPGEDKKLSEVVNGLFPNVDVILFSSFLALRFSNGIKEAIQKEPRFRLMRMGLSWSGEMSDAEISELIRQREAFQIEETANIIFSFFKGWRQLTLYKNDLSEEENANWKDYSEEKQKQILGRVRRLKLEQMLEELNSSEVIEMCKDLEILESRRSGFINLVQLLIEHIDT